MKLQSMPYASARVYKNTDGSMELYSYQTLVIFIDKDGWMDCTGTYSATTRKHIGAFMRNEASKLSGHKLDYYTAKRCYLNNETINIYTGEVKKIG